MKLSTTLLLGLSTLQSLPLALSAAITSTSLDTPTLSPRRYNVGSWLATRASFRTWLSGGLGVSSQCSNGDTHRKTVTSIDFPDGIRRPTTFGSNEAWIDVCSGIRHCQGGSWGPWINSECPDSEEALINHMLHEGRNWQPPLTRDEAYEALHRLDPATWPDSPLPNGSPNRDPVAAISNAFNNLIYTLTGANRQEQGPAPQAAAAKAGAPAQHQKGTTSRCTKWYVAKGGDSCYWVAKNNGCSLGAFYGWNPAVNDGGECSQLWVGWAYCVSTK